jgi:DNA-binding transcriptional MerR regulator/methylmalonyl-CoA mutase cobalamin-binding subunit
MPAKATPVENNNAMLSIGGLSRLSGVAVETLRTWERRYGFPEPTRLASGHRRYSSDTVSRLRLVRRATELGFKASFAVTAPTEELEAAIHEAEVRDAKNGVEARPSELDREIASWLDRSSELDAVGFEVALRRAWSRYGAREFVVKLAVPFLKKVGERWFDNSISVAHEHFTSEQLTAFFARQWRPISKQARSGKAVVACLEGDHHHLGIHMAAVFLSLNDFEVIFLGPDTPLEDIVIATQEPGVVTVVIGLAVTSDLKKGERSLQKLRAAVPASITIVVGGNNDIPPVKGVTHLDSLDAFADFVRSLSDIYSGMS